MKNESMHTAIKFLNANGLNVISTRRQIKNGTIMVQDTKVPNEEGIYTLHSSGYVRSKISSSISPWSSGLTNHYQLNPTQLISRTNQWGTYNETIRILYPGEYVSLAKIVVRVATKRRNRKMAQQK